MQHNVTDHNGACAVMLSVVMQSVIIQSVVMLNVVMQSVVILIVVIVVAPNIRLGWKGHSSLVRLRIRYSCKKFYETGPSVILLQVHL